ncbi:MAG: bifunctional indole-3-glycerol-phosphate synthase TrpC/phosphoribosylanthranilate isomerase TrpF [Anaerolineae bacterium]|jgi:indole-3-glycerol phosphate synthase/phosphoribosylanthranilate isomerase
MAAPTILDEILHWKRAEVERRKEAVPLEAVRAAAAQAPPPRDLAAALRAPGVGLIAEVKRASPSKGALRPDLDAAALAGEYEAAGAAAISVLTDRRFFQGGLNDLRAVGANTGLPVLCKDFFLDPYQVYEARAAGADAILLIVAALDDEGLAALARLAAGLGLATLIEVHDGAELDRALAAVPAGEGRIVGINNRDLHTFRVSLDTTARLRDRVPAGTLLVSESGIQTAADVGRLAEMGVDAMLVGESLVRAPDVAAQVRRLVGGAAPRVKICGLSEPGDALCAAEAGADFLGFVFYAKSPRYVAPDRAATITAAVRDAFGPASPRMVGVFVDEAPGRVAGILERAGLDLAQLHGGEPPDQIRALRPRAFKAIRPQTPAEAGRAATRYYAVAPGDQALPQLLLDAYQPGAFGGTGLRADPALARDVARRGRLLLAGGLDADNAAAAVEAVRPWGLDVSSGVERARGVKDRGRIRAFVAAVKGGAA